MVSAWVMRSIAARAATNVETLKSCIVNVERLVKKYDVCEAVGSELVSIVEELRWPLYLSAYCCTSTRASISADRNVSMYRKLTASVGG